MDNENVLIRINFSLQVQIKMHNPLANQFNNTAVPNMTGGMSVSNAINSFFFCKINLFNFFHSLISVLLRKVQIKQHHQEDQLIHSQIPKARQSLQTAIQMIQQVVLKEALAMHQVGVAPAPLLIAPLKDTTLLGISQLQVYVGQVKKQYRILFLGHKKFFPP